MKDKESCQTCEFKGELNGMNNCVRYPPHVAPIQGQNQITGEVSLNMIVLPVQVAGDYWCGEFKEKQKKLASVN